MCCKVKPSHPQLARRDEYRPERERRMDPRKTVTAQVRWSENNFKRMFRALLLWHQDQAKLSRSKAFALKESVTWSSCRADPRGLEDAESSEKGSKKVSLTDFDGSFLRRSCFQVLGCTWWHINYLNLFDELIDGIMFSGMCWCCHSTGVDTFCASACSLFKIGLRNLRCFQLQITPQSWSSVQMSVDSSLKFSELSTLASVVFHRLPQVSRHRTRGPLIGW